MSDGQLSALLAKLKGDATLRDKLKAAPDLQTAALIAKEAGFEISGAELATHFATQPEPINDENLEGFAGGAAGITGLPNYYPIVGGMPNPCPNA